MRRAVGWLVVAAAACSNGPFGGHGGPVDAARPSTDAPGTADASQGDTLPDAGSLVPQGADPFGPLVAMPGACSGDSWCWRSPTPHGNAYDHVFSTAPDNVWLTAWGFVEQWDGQSWTTHHPPVGAGLTGSQFSMSIGGSSATNMWLIYGPQLEHWDGSAWTILESLPDSGSPNYNCVWVSPDGDAWVTISDGTLEHWHDGVETKLGAGSYLGSIWGTSATDIFITTFAGILHYDGTTFTQIYGGPLTLAGFSGVPGDVWVSGGEGGMGHWDGTTFTDVSSMLPAAIASAGIQPIAYLASNNIWWYVMLNGAYDGFVHWDGSAITFTVEGGDDFNDGAIIGGRWWLVGGYGDVYTTSAGANGDAVPTLVPEIANPWYQVTSIWGSSDRDMYFTAAGALSHWDGSAYTNIALDLGSNWGSVSFVTGLNTNGVDELFVSGYQEVTPAAGSASATFEDVVLHFDGTTWTKTAMAVGSFDSLCGIGQPVGSPPGAALIAVLGPGDALGIGTCGTAYHYAGSAWTAVATHTTDALTGVWAGDANHAWIVDGAIPGNAQSGNRGVLAWVRSAPTATTPDPVPASQTQNPSNGGVWPLGAVTGVNGMPWIASTELTNPTTQETTGVIYERGGSGWTEVTAWPVTSDPAAGLLAISATDVVFTCESASNLYRFDGSAWNFEDNASYLSMGPAFAVPGGSTWVGGYNGIVSHP